MSVHENGGLGGLMVSGRNISWKPMPLGKTRTALDKNEAEELIGFNDITTDDAGRSYAGALGSSPAFEDGRGPRLATFT